MQFLYVDLVQTLKIISTEGTQRKCHQFCFVGQFDSECSQMGYGTCENAIVISCFRVHAPVKFPAQRPYLKFDKNTGKIKKRGLRFCRVLTLMTKILAVTLTLPL